jgi:hypothetical protein
VAKVDYNCVIVFFFFLFLQRSIENDLLKDVCYYQEQVLCYMQNNHHPSQERHQPDPFTPSIPSGRYKCPFQEER